MNSLAHKSEMSRRRNERASRVATTLEERNLKRLRRGMRLIKPPRDRYPGWRLRALRRDPTNWLGQLRR